MISKSIADLSRKFFYDKKSKTGVPVAATKKAHVLKNLFKKSMWLIIWFVYQWCHDMNFLLLIIPVPRPILLSIPVPRPILLIIPVPRPTFFTQNWHSGVKLQSWTTQKPLTLWTVPPRFNTNSLVSADLPSYFYSVVTWQKMRNNLVKTQISICSMSGCLLKSSND